MFKSISIATILYSLLSWSIAFADDNSIPQKEQWAPQFYCLGYENNSFVECKLIGQGASVTKIFTEEDESLTHEFPCGLLKKIEYLNGFYMTVQVIKPEGILTGVLTESRPGYMISKKGTGCSGMM